MQNNQSNHKWKTFLKTRGYGVLLGLCAAAVAVSGYVFFRDASAQQQELEESLSTPVTVSELPTELLVEEPEQNAQTSAEDSEEKLEPVQGTFQQTVMPVSGQVLRDYAMDHLSYNETTQDWRVHNGVDLASPLGQEVCAARAGTVTAVYDDEYYGTTVVVQHDDGYTSHYASLAEDVLVQVADTVSAGQKLGTVGATALIEAAQEPHLHFEVYLNGEPVDPAGFLY